MMASEAYRLRIMPAGRNDRMAEISDSAGRVLRYISCPWQLGDYTAGLDAVIRRDFDTLPAVDFARKYDLPSTKDDGA